MNKQTVIRFMVEVNQQSSNALITVVENELKKGVDKFKILISSPGGTVFHGISIYNFLKGIPAIVETHNFGTIDTL